MIIIYAINNIYYIICTMPCGRGGRWPSNGIIVELDESKYGRRKYNRDRSGQVTASNYFDMNVWFSRLQVIREIERVVAMKE